MDRHTAEETLKEYIEKGVINEIIYASMAAELFKDIARHKDGIVEARLSTLFYQLQAYASSQQTLHLTKIFDPLKRQYATHGIVYVLDFIEKNTPLWIIKDRKYLTRKAIIDINDDMTDEDIVKRILSYYRSSFPQTTKDASDPLSMSLKAMRESRDKIIAHNEHIPDESIRTKPTWGNATMLTEYAKDFAVTVLQVFTGLHFSESSFNGTANIVVKNLRSLLGMAGIFPSPNFDEESA
jgi:hypothetical protein